MPGPEDEIIGKLAIQLGLISPGQLDQLMELSQQFKKPIASILTEQGAVSPDDIQRINTLRKLNLESEGPPGSPKQDAIVLARHMVQEKIMDRTTAEEILREMAAEDWTKTLEDAAADRGVATREKIAELKSLKQKRSMHCPKCNLNFNVKSVSGRKEIDCPKCKGRLEERQAPGAAEAGALTKGTVEFKTTVMKAIEPDRPPAPSAKPAKPAPKGKTINVQCIICDTMFTSEIDLGGRVKCTSCGSSFDPKR